MQGLLNKRPEKRLDWPHLLDHPFVKESEEERLMREERIFSAAACAEASRAWKGEGGAIAGAAVYSGTSHQPTLPRFVTKSMMAADGKSAHELFSGLFVAKQGRKVEIL